LTRDLWIQNTTLQITYPRSYLVNDAKCEDTNNRHSMQNDAKSHLWGYDNTKFKLWVVTASTTFIVTLLTVAPKRI